MYMYLNICISLSLSHVSCRLRTIKETKSNHPQKKRSLCRILSRIRHASENSRGIFTKTGSNVQGHEFTQSTLPKQASKCIVQQCSRVDRVGASQGCKKHHLV